MRDRRLPANIAALLLSTVFSLIFLEVAYRVYLFGLDGLSIEKMNSIHDLGDSGLLKTSEYPEIAFELRPNMNTYFKLASVETNSRGLRDREHDLTKPEDTFRVAVIGDSLTMASGVDIADTYHKVLERRLNLVPGSLRYEFINFGVGAYSLRQYWAVMYHKILKYEPDMVLVGFTPLNDYKIPAAKLFDRPYTVKPETHPFFESFAILRLRREPDRQRKKMDIESRDATVCSEPEEEYMRDLFSKMSAFGGEHGIPIVIVYLLHKPTELRCGEKVRDTAESSGLAYTIARVPPESAGTGRYKIHPLDGHPNEEAHAIFADQIHDYLRQSKLLERTNEATSAGPAQGMPPRLR